MDRLLGLEGDTGRICRFFGRVTARTNRQASSAADMDRSDFTGSLVGEDFTVQFLHRDKWTHKQTGNRLHLTGNGN